MPQKAKAGRKTALSPKPLSDFLGKEYDQCMGLIRYYDERQASLTRFSVLVSTGVAGALFSFQSSARTLATGERVFLSLIACLALLALFALIVATRIYFVRPSRQANAIRNLALADFPENRMYTNADLPALHLGSTQTLLGASVALQSGGFLGWGILSATGSMGWSVFGAIVLAAALFGLGAYFLKKEDGRRTP
jgi:hypothetical protein